VEEASLLQLQILYDNIKFISPSMLDYWLKWIDGDNTYIKGNLDGYLNSLLQYPWGKY
jgi:hypothetical protein